MTLRPLLEAPPAVQIHVITVILAFLVGSVILFISRKGSPFHRIAGAAFLTLMASTAIVALFIHRRMPHSPIFGLSHIHLLSLFVLFAIWRALDGIYKGNIEQHRIWVRGIYGGALVITGLLNIFFSSGITHDIFF
jgi:uncharacterized membrane protein